MKIVITQPMFLPWRGIFEQMRLCDVFVVFDGFQLPKGGGKGRNFMTRVQVKTRDGWRWLSAPVARAAKGYQMIREARFADDSWRRSHLSLIQQAYRKAPCFDAVFHDIVLPIYAFKTEFLSEFCVNSMKILADALQLDNRFVPPREIKGDFSEEPSQRLVDMCRHFEADEYLTGHGAKHYINYDLLENAGIAVRYMNYNLTPYAQLHGGFNPYVTVLDLLFNVGRDAAKILGFDGSILERIA